MTAFLAILLSLLILTSVSEGNKCRNQGESCSKTVFQKCCGRLVCDLSGFAKGKCVRCLSARKACWRNRDCCSGKCSWFKCK
ncbi:hypothetical protein SprV_0200611200 [Sparganum proliferum]